MIRRTAEIDKPVSKTEDSFDSITSARAYNVIKREDMQSFHYNDEDVDRMKNEKMIKSEEMSYKSVSARYAVTCSCSAGYQNVTETEEKHGKNGRNKGSDSRIVEHFSIAHCEKKTFESYTNQSYGDTVANGPTIDDQTSEVIKSYEIHCKTDIHDDSNSYSDTLQTQNMTEAEVESRTASPGNINTIKVEEIPYGTDTKDNSCSDSLVVAKCLSAQPSGKKRFKSSYQHFASDSSFCAMTSEEMSYKVDNNTSDANVVELLNVVHFLNDSTTKTSNNLHSDTVPSQSDQRGLSGHSKQCTEIKPTTDKPKKPTTVKNGKPTREKIFKCTLCAFTSLRLAALKSHIKTHTARKLYKCDVCDYSSSHSGHLKRHKLIHTGDKPYTCDLCDYATRRSEELRKHKMKHNGKQLKCNSCDYATTSTAHLREHKRTHTGERPYKCDLCSYRAIQWTTLNKHKLIHTGEKPYKCDLCDYSTTHLRHVKEHMLIHTNEKPYKCDLCDYSTTHNGHLKKHRMIHTGDKPYKCDQCSFIAIEPRYLTTHKMIHTGEKPFKCDLCAFSSLQYENLKQHKLIHTGDTSACRTYQCDVCKYSTQYPQVLKRHKLRHTREKS